MRHLSASPVPNHSFLMSLNVRLPCVVHGLLEKPFFPPRSDSPRGLQVYRNDWPGLTRPPAVPLRNSPPRLSSNLIDMIILYRRRRRTEHLSAPVLAHHPDSHSTRPALVRPYSGKTAHRLAGARSWCCPSTCSGWTCTRSRRIGQVTSPRFPAGLGR